MKEMEEVTVGEKEEVNKTNKRRVRGGERVVNADIYVFIKAYLLDGNVNTSTLNTVVCSLVKQHIGFPIQKLDEEMGFSTLTFLFVDNTVSIVTFLQRKKEQYSHYTRIFI